MHAHIELVDAVAAVIARRQATVTDRHFFPSLFSALRLYLAPAKSKNILFWIVVVWSRDGSKVCAFRMCEKERVECRRQQLIELKRWRSVNPLSTECRLQSSATPYIVRMYGPNPR